jgi:hypothetical protein
VVDGVEGSVATNAPPLAQRIAIAVRSLLRFARVTVRFPCASIAACPTRLDGRPFPLPRLGLKLRTGRSARVVNVLQKLVQRIWRKATLPV